MSPCNNQYEGKETEQTAVSSAMILSFPFSAYCSNNLCLNPTDDQHTCITKVLLTLKITDF